MQLNKYIKLTKLKKKFKNRHTEFFSINFKSISRLGKLLNNIYGIHCFYINQKFNTFITIT